MSWVEVSDFQFPQGWDDVPRGGQRAQWACEQLEEGQILFFKEPPFALPEEDCQFLLNQRQSDTRLHKNVSYRPKQDVLRGWASAGNEQRERMRQIMRDYSGQVANFLSELLAPYAPQWSLDYASFRPEEEKGRDLPLHKRNDLLHVDSFPTRPTQGGRILRCFTNINPTQARIWCTTVRLPILARNFAKDAGLMQIAERGTTGMDSFVHMMKKTFGMKAVQHSPYDKFMLRFHDYLKENRSFQENCQKLVINFPPRSTWICFTDSVPHAVLSGQYALEQTFIVPIQAMVKPEKAPIRVLEQIAQRPLADASPARVK
jgi:hypothetical protein